MAEAPNGAKLEPTRVVATTRFAANENYISFDCAWDKPSRISNPVAYMLRAFNLKFGKEAWFAGAKANNTRVAVMTTTADGRSKVEALGNAILVSIHQPPITRLHLTDLTFLRSEDVKAELEATLGQIEFFKRFGGPPNAQGDHEWGPTAVVGLILKQEWHNQGDSVLERLIEVKLVVDGKEEPWTFRTTKAKEKERKPNTKRPAMLREPLPMRYNYTLKQGANKAAPDANSLPGHVDAPAKDEKSALSLQLVHAVGPGVPDADIQQALPADGNLSAQHGFANLNSAALGPPPNLQGEALQAWFAQQKALKEAIDASFFEEEFTSGADVPAAPVTEVQANTLLGKQSEMDEDGDGWLQSSSASTWAKGSEGWKAEDTSDIPAKIAEFAGLSEFHASARRAASTVPVPTAPEADWKTVTPRRSKSSKFHGRERSLSPTGSGSFAKRGRPYSTDSAPSSRASSTDSRSTDSRTNRGGRGGRGGGGRSHQGHQGLRLMAASGERGGISSTQ